MSGGWLIKPLLLVLVKVVVWVFVEGFIMSDTFMPILAATASMALIFAVAAAAATAAAVGII